MINIHSIHILDQDGKVLSSYKDDIFSSHFVELDILKLSKDTFEYSIIFEHVVLNKVSAKFLKIDLKWDYSKVEKCFSNGFQTWTESKWFNVHEKIKVLNWLAKPIWSFFNMRCYGDYNHISYQTDDIHSYHFTSLKYPDSIQLISSLNETDGFTVFSHVPERNQLSISKELNLSASKTKCSFRISKQSKHKFHSLNEAFYKSIDCSSLTTKPITGWTSWYNHYTKINEDLIVENLQNFVENKIPIDIFQIDDGWQRSVGDWEVNSKFPGGFKPIIEHAHKNNIQAGLWMAPFICEKKSKIFYEHQDWIRIDKLGKKVIAGYSLDWSGTFYVLEWRKPEVQNHIKRSLQKILFEWGFDLMKLDFLYAVTLGLTDINKGKEMHDAMLWLRAIFTGKSILACGVPLASCYGLVEYCRISSDIGLKWEDKLLSDFVKYRERVSVVNALRSTIARSTMHLNAFINDPDVYILRKENNKLSKEQRNCLYIINQALGGLQFTSDDISRYGSEEFDFYLKQFPIRNRSVSRSHTFDDHGWVILKNRELEYLLIYNLNNDTKSLDLPSGQWVDNNGLHSGIKKLNAFEARVMLKYESSKKQFIYSNGHLFPGMEFDLISVQGNKIAFELNKDCRIQNMDFIFEVDGSYSTFHINGIKKDIEKWYGLSVVKFKHQLST